MIDALLQSEVEKYQLPVLSVAASLRGEEVVSFGFGNTQPHGQQPVNADTQFGVASITKLITAIQLLLLCEEQHLTLEDPVAQHLPEWNHAKQKPVQLHHMLSHTSGLPGLDTRFKALDLNDTVIRAGQLRDATDLVQYLNQQDIQPLAAPGQLLNYSNECFCLSGALIEKYRRGTYSELTAEMVFQPLGMRRSCIGQLDATETKNIALPLVQTSQGFQQTAFWDAPLFYPAGGAVSSARDLVKLFSALAVGQRYLSGHTKKQLLKSRILIPSRPGYGSAYGLGLEIQPLANNQTLYWHSGQRTGIASFAGYIPQVDLSLAVLCNVADSPVTAIAFKLISSLLGRADITWPPIGTARSQPDAVCTGYAGRYTNEENFALTVVCKNGRHYLQYGEDKALHEMVFYGECYGSVSGQTYRFLKQHRNDPQPWAIAVDLRILLRTD